MVTKIFAYQEPLESYNKIFKRFREQFTRKHSRKDTFFDIFFRTSVMSDPIIVDYFFKIRKNLRNKSNPFPAVVLSLLKPTDENGLK